MKKSTLLLSFMVFVFYSCNHSYEKPEVHQNETSDFKLSYVYTGLGSGYNTMQPVFAINGNDCIYTIQENSSFSGDFTNKSDTIFEGKIRVSSIDSIIDIISEIPDTLIYRTDESVLSGGIHTIIITNGSKEVTFNLHNSTHPEATKIVTILNSNIPRQYRKLWLFTKP